MTLSSKYVKFCVFVYNFILDDNASLRGQSPQGV